MSAFADLGSVLNSFLVKLPCFVESDQAFFNFQCLSPVLSLVHCMTGNEIHVLVREPAYH